MKSLKVKLVSIVSAFILALSLLIIGVWAVGEAQHINLSGSVNFTISNDTLYIKDIRIRDANDLTGQGSTIENFIPGFVNGDFDLDLGERTADTSFTLLFDVINTTETTYEASTTSVIPNASLSVSGIINGDGIEPSAISSSTEPSGTIVLTVIVSSAGLVSLDGVVINIKEYVEPVLQVTNVQINDATPDTTTEFNGIKGLTSTIDLSNITFETGQTEIIISMTSLNANYIKNIVSYDSGVVDYNTTGTSGTLFVHSTSLYLPQNTSGELTSGESKDLTIYVNNNTGSPTTISGLQVSFEEKESLLQADTTNNYWYVEMGTVMGQTESEYIRWKYIASVDDSSGSDVATKYATFDANTAPTGEGYFYLETNVLTAIGRDGTNNMIEVSFNNDYTNSSPYCHNLHGWTNVRANDYATSNVRQYINGNDSYDGFKDSNSIFTPRGRESNMYDDLNIDTVNDIIYNQIITRSLGELYQDNTSSTTNPSDVTFPDLSGADAGYQYQETDEDAFWLLSGYEVYNLVGSSNSDRVWPSDSVNSYWLRSPYSSTSISVYYVSTSSNLGSSTVNSHYSAARAAFKFSI